MVLLTAYLLVAMSDLFSNSGVGRGIMLLLRLSQGIPSECHHTTPTPIFFEVSLLWEGGIMLPLRLRLRNYSGCYHANRKQKFFFELLLWEGALCFCFDLAKVFLQGATMPTLQPIFFGIVIVGRALCFCFDLTKVFLQGGDMPPLNPPKFLDLSLLWEGALCFCFDLAKVFL